MTAQPPRPPGPPTPSSMQDVADFAALVATSLTDVRSTAEKWRTGLAALITLTTTALLIKGPENARDLSTGWRSAVTAALIAGLSLAVAGLWRALEAAAGTPEAVTLDAILARHGSVKAFRIAQANAAITALRSARRLVMASIVLLTIGILGWWWAPVTEDAPVLNITTGGKSVCGEVDSADHGAIRLQVRGEADPRTIPLSQVENLAVAASCP